MTDKTYIKFQNPKSDLEITPDGPIKRIFKIGLVKFFEMVLPIANPDFEKLLDDVEYWNIEYDLKENATWREIGFDKNDVAILAMPLDKNYGFWTDNHLTLEDYKRFNSKEISADHFIENWNKFESEFRKQR